MAFSVGYLALQTSKFFHKASWKFKKIPSWLGHIIVWYLFKYYAFDFVNFFRILGQTIFSFLGLSFMLITFDKVWILWKRCYYVPLTLLITYLFFVITSELIKMIFTIMNIEWGQRRPREFRRDEVIIKDETEEFLKQQQELQARQREKYLRERYKAQ